MAYGVYFLFHDWRAEALQRAIDSYMEQLHEIPAASEFLEEKYIPEPTEIERLPEDMSYMMARLRFPYHPCAWL